MSRRVKTARCVLLLVALCLAASPASGVELVSIPSQDGKLQLPGYWFEAAVAGPRPTVILLHGCGGALDRKGRLSRNRARVAEFLNVEGMHALVVDSFTPRGETSICQTPPSRRRIQPEDRRDDVFAAIQWLARRPIVDASRIAVVGYSNGGGAVLSVLDRTARAVRSQPLQPRLAIAFYPPCARYATMWRYEIGAPLLLMIGELDDWTPAHHCVRLHDRVKREQPDASFELVLYPESHHGFDSYGPPRLRFGLSTASGRATVGGNAEARDRALRRMFEFLSARLGTPLRLTHDASGDIATPCRRRAASPGSTTSPRSPWTRRGASATGATSAGALPRLSRSPRRAGPTSAWTTRMPWGPSPRRASGPG